LISEGSIIKKDDPLILVESEKASMEIPATLNGTVEKIHVNKGDTIAPGKIIISMQPNDETQIQDKKQPSEILSEKYDRIESDNTEIANTATSDKYQHNDPSQMSITKPMGSSVIASPSVRRFSRELGCDLSLVKGTGPKDRISKEDIQKYIKDRLTETPSGMKSLHLTAPGQNLDFSRWGDVTIQPLNKIKIITGDRLQRAWQAIPHVTQFDKADITKLDQLRISLKKIVTDTNIKISILPFIMKAVTRILLEMPIFNSSLDNNKNIVLKNYYHIGIAVDTENGLVVPVIRNVDQKNIKELTKELNDISERARNKKLLPADMEGGCFTISNLGGIGGNYFTPIINPPQVAILGISRMQIDSVLISEKFQKRKMLPFSLSYDHRVIDGADAARFTTNFAKLLSNIEELTDLK